MLKTSFSKAHSKYLESAAAQADLYVQITNRLLGTGAFTVGLAVLTVAHSKFWASMGLIMLVSWWGISIEGLRAKLEELKYMDHDVVDPINLAKRMLPALVGMFFLASIAGEEITQYKFFLPL